jgi:hypothetical protein
MHHYPGRAMNKLKTTSSRLLGKEFVDKLKPVYRQPVFWCRYFVAQGSPRACSSPEPLGTNGEELK